MSIFALIVCLFVFVVVVIIFCDFCIIAGNRGSKSQEDDEGQMAWCSSKMYKKKNQGKFNHKK